MRGTQKAAPGVVSTEGGTGNRISGQTVRDPTYYSSITASRQQGRERDGAENGKTKGCPKL